MPMIMVVDRTAGPCWLSMFQHLLHGKPNIFCDLAKQNWRDVSIAVKGDGRTTTIKVAKLLCDPALPNFYKTWSFEDSLNF
jgi:hypothetical protein